MVRSQEGVRGEAGGGGGGGREGKRGDGMRWQEQVGRQQVTRG